MVMRQINQICSGLTEIEPGLWAKPSSQELAYPPEGNKTCLQLEADSFWFNHRNNAIFELTRLFPYSGLFLDVGGGNGFVSQFLQQQGQSVLLLEPGIDGARQAIQRGVSPVICTTVQDASLEDRCIGAAGAFDVIEHIEDDLGFLNDLRGKISHKGKLYLTVPAWNCLWSDEDIYAGHYRRYSTQSLSALLRKAGFKPLYVGYFFSFLPLPIFLLRSIPSFLGFRKTDDVNQYKKEHSAPKGLGHSVLNSFLKWELNTITKGSRIPFGSSCIAVAEVED